MIGYDGGAATHVGAVRPINQDRMLLSGTIAAVADGMGGHAGGEKAAALAIGELSGVRGTISADRFHKVVEAANRRIYETSSDPALRGMGTTIVAAAVDAEAEQLNIVNVGDSRAYRLRGGQLEQLTIDHSLVEDLVREGRLSPEEALTHPQRNIVTRALGINPEIEIDMFIVDALIGDRFILCSDGLFNEVDDDGIIAILLEVKPADDAAAMLVEAAVALGGRDNVTVVVIDIFDPDNPPTQAVLADELGDDTTEPVGPITAVMDPVFPDVVPDESAIPNNVVDHFGQSHSADDPANDPANDPADVSRFVPFEAPVDDTTPETAPDLDPAPSPGVPEPDAAMPPPPGPDDEQLAAPAPTDSGVGDRDDDHTGDGADDRDRGPKRRWLPFRTSLILFFSVVGVVGFGLGGSAWYARSAYFVDEVDGEVVIFKGRPGGVLWFEPVTVENTQIDVDTLNGASRELLRNKTPWRSVLDAREFVRNLEPAPSGGGAIDGG